MQMYPIFCVTIATPSLLLVWGACNHNSTIHPFMTGSPAPLPISHSLEINFKFSNFSSLVLDTNFYNWRVGQIEQTIKLLRL